MTPPTNAGLTTPTIHDNPLDPYTKPVPHNILDGRQTNRLSEVARLLGHQQHWEDIHREALKHTNGNPAPHMVPIQRTRQDTLDPNTVYGQILHRLTAITHPHLHPLTGKWLRTNREAFNIRVEDLATQLDIHTPSIYRWETGEREPTKAHATELNHIMRDHWEEEHNQTAIWLCWRQGYLAHQLDKDATVQQVMDWMRTTLTEENELALVEQARRHIPLQPWNSRHDTHPMAMLGYNPPDNNYWTPYVRTTYQLED